jgi:NADH pyrophosphatase NudC (nudix superfamily)
MSLPDDAKDSSNRLRQAQKIVHHPEQYKVCEGCGSIVVSRALSCPSCHGYRFDTTPSRIVSQAQALALQNPSSVLASDLT